jgi:hypothetical protein
MPLEHMSIAFPTVDPATASQYAGQLRQQLLQVSVDDKIAFAETEIRLKREDPEALDAGSIIELVGHFMTPVVAHVVASSVIEWVKWRKTTVKLKNGVFELNVDSGADEQFIKRVIRFFTGDHTPENSGTSNNE